MVTCRTGWVVTAIVPFLALTIIWDRAADQRLDAPPTPTSASRSSDT